MKKKILFPILITSVFLICSCLSLPAPSDDGDTLLIIPVKLLRKDNFDWFGKFQITIKSTDTGKIVKKLFLPTHYALLKITNLPPGNYKISRILFIYDSDGKTGSDETTNIPFTLYPNEMTILKTKFSYELNTNRREGKNWIYIQWGPNSPTNQVNLLNRLKEYENFDLWEFNQFKPRDNSPSS